MLLNNDSFQYGTYLSGLYRCWHSTKTICKTIDEEAFKYPFYDLLIRHNASDNQERYELDKLEITSSADDLELKGFIFHTSHCGSTLLCQMLNELESVRVVSESEAINGLLLSAILHNLDKEEVIRSFRQIIQLFCQKSGSESDLIIKLTSWNVYHIQLIKEAFPDTKWLFLERPMTSY